MCVMMFKPEGTPLQSKFVQYCFSTNRDGAGFMYPKDGKVVIQKGYMTYKALVSALNELIKERGTIRDIPMLLHFRIGTQGAKCPELTHPYPVCRDYNKMRKTKTECMIAMGHNGIIRSCVEYGALDRNDSMKYIYDYVADIINGDSKFYKSPSKMRLLNQTCETSRLGFMNGEGMFVPIGSWYECGGYLFSHPVAIKED